MDISGKTILVLGGWGLVGAAVCRRLIEQKPARLVITSLNQGEAESAVADLRTELPADSGVELIAWNGNIFCRYDDRFTPREQLLADSTARRRSITDVVDDLTPEVLEASALYHLLSEYRPDAVIDCINSATAIAYQDIFGSARTMLQAIDAGALDAELAERHLATLYVPQLIRHVQILYRGLLDAETKMYIKIGTAGSGGMGLNIPYTHSEERPSRVLLGKSAVAGAQTLLLFLMGRTPDGPIIKEIKPTATIAWKRIGNGEVKRRGRPIPLVDCPPERGVKLEGTLQLHQPGVAEPLGRNLEAPFIDTGENGIFSRAEFEAITSLQQMEMITPEEIADATVLELKGGNSGHDVVQALDGAVYGPTYRGGVLRGRALYRLEQLEEESKVPSVAFEMLGPPRLSKLLFEAHILGRAVGSIDGVIAGDAAQIAGAAEAIIRADADLRSRALSVGIPVLLGDGVTLLRGESIKIPPHRGSNALEINPESVDSWAQEGWIDLREANIRRWQERFERIKSEALAVPETDTSSREQFSRDYWGHFRSMPEGKIAAWIFTVEDEGARMKA